MDVEILHVRNTLNGFRHEMNAMTEATEVSGKLVSDCDHRVAGLTGDVTNMRASILEFTATTAR